MAEDTFRFSSLIHTTRFLLHSPYLDFLVLLRGGKMRRKERWRWKMIFSIKMNFGSIFEFYFCTSEEGWILTRQDMTNPRVPTTDAGNTLPRMLSLVLCRVTIASRPRALTTATTSIAVYPVVGRCLKWHTLGKDIPLLTLRLYNSLRVLPPLNLFRKKKKLYSIFINLRGLRKVTHIFQVKYPPLGGLE